MNLEQYAKLARGLVDLFYPMVESTLFNEDGSIHEIFNAFSTIKEDQACDVQNCQTNAPFSEWLVGGKNVRSFLYPYYENKRVIGYLRLRYDLTHFKNLQEQLNFLVQSTFDSPVPQSTIDPWKQSIDQMYPCLSH